MTNIIIQINPHEDGVRCGECQNLNFSCESATDECWFGWVLWPWDGEQYVAHRGPLCLAAEERLKRLVEAGGALQDYVLCGDGSIADIWEPWDSALAALEPEE